MTWNVIHFTHNWLSFLIVARRRLGRHLRPADPVRLRRVLAALARAQVFVPQISREGYSAHPFVPRDIAKSWLDRSAFDQTIKKHLAKLGKPDS